ncbi:peptidyl-tRNA hydrolase isoform X5 [Pan paniscus]|uniref:peptidyl-tRNA hydrolase isoform X5 n=1 Tax=Pan paniscus TaxID=9597 RepID=UPI00155F9C89|nr:probable peptidyl-tRNA hydrolase isoform X2 [Pan paniscus]
MTSGGGVGVNGGSMRPGGFLGAGQRLSRAMSRCVLEPRPPGKRWMVAGLGNPGLPGTRHSVGMAVLGQLARRLGVAESWTRDRHCAADLALAPLGDAQLVLLRPRRLMNANGRSVARAGLAWTHRQQQQQQHHHHHHHHHHHQWLSPHCASWEPGSASRLHGHYRREQSHLSGSCGKRPRVDLTQVC